MRLLFETKIERSYLEIKSRFNLELFLALKPPLVNLSVKRFDGCSPGNEVHVELNTMGKRQDWVSVITRELQDNKEWSFMDEGKIMPWPFALWKHHHRVVSLDEKSSKIVDDITFECAPRWMDVLLYPVMWSVFSIRPIRYRKYFQGN